MCLRATRYYSQSEPPRFPTHPLFKLKAKIRATKPVQYVTASGCDNCYFLIYLPCLPFLLRLLDSCAPRNPSTARTEVCKT